MVDLPPKIYVVIRIVPDINSSKVKYLNIDYHFANKSLDPDLIVNPSSNLLLFVKLDLGPALAKHNYSHVNLIILDDNRPLLPEWAIKVNIIYLNHTYVCVLSTAVAIME